MEHLAAETVPHRQLNPQTREKMERGEQQTHVKAGWNFHAMSSMNLFQGKYG